MSFNTLDFIILFFTVLALYYVLPQKYRNPLLLVASYVFYSQYDLKLTLFLVVVTIVSYYIAIKIEHYSDKEQKKAKNWMIAGVVMSLATLAFYKYSTFLLETTSKLFGASKTISFSFLVPLGISFITFTVISYLVDVYRHKIAAEHGFLKYALFVSFFPKVAQGPIVKAGDLLPQFDEEHHFDIIRYRRGMIMILYGLFMKMVVADNAAIIVNTIYGNLGKYGGAEILMATVLFSIQIYCDFAGYSNVAIGTAHVLGFDLKQNFRQPYLSTSVAEFWRRWHISLNRWLTEYLYIPLGGSRCSKARKYFNTLVTFGLSGLWHGADWGYIVWGLINGLYIIAGSEIKILKDKRKAAVGAPSDGAATQAGESSFKRLSSTLGTFVLVMFSWVFFRAMKLPVAIQAISRMVTKFDLVPFLKNISQCLAGGKTAYFYGLSLIYRVPFLILGILTVFVIDILAARSDVNGELVQGNRAVRWAIAFILIFAIMIFGVYGYGYSAGNFIYAGF